MLWALLFHFIFLEAVSETGSEDEGKDKEPQEDSVVPGQGKARERPHDFIYDSNIEGLILDKREITHKTISAFSVTKTEVAPYM